MKNILLVANWESGVGYAWWLMENFWVEIDRHFSAKDYKVFLIYPKITTIPATIEASNINILLCDYEKPGFTGFRELASLIRQHDIGYLYLTDRPHFSLKNALLHLTGIKRIVIHDHTPGYRTAATGIRKLVKKLKNRLPLFPADHLVAVSEYVRQRFLNTYCWPQDKCSVAPNGIVPYTLDAQNKDYAYTQFHIPKDATIVISTGRANSYKRIDFIIDCANKVISEYGMTKLYFIYCGDGPDIDSFKKRAEEYRLGDHFVFAGNRSDVPRLLQSATIGIHASRGEVGYSLSILEYMSAGLITLVPDNPSVCAAIRDKKNGYIYPEGDIEVVAELLRDIVKEPEQNELISKDAIETVKKEFNLTQTNKALIECLSNIFN